MPLETFLSNYGLIAVVIGTFFEGETVLVLAGLAAHRGYLPLPAVVAAGILGTIVGDHLYFYIGRRHGDAFLSRRPGWRSRVARAQAFLERHHVLFILGFRVLYGLRTISPFAVGMSDVRLLRFLILDVFTAVIWSAGVALLGYSVGEGAQTLLGEVRRFELWLFAGLTAGGLLLWLAHHMHRRRRNGRASASSPQEEGRTI